MWHIGRGPSIPRVEAAHEVVALQSTVHDGIVALLVDAFLGNLGVDPVGIPPHVRTNLTELDSGLGVVLDRLLERLVEVAIVEENIGVVVPTVEVALDRLHGLNNTLQLLVSGENDEGGIGTGLAGIWLEATCDEDFVVLFANFSAVGFIQVSIRGFREEETESKEEN